MHLDGRIQWPAHRARPRESKPTSSQSTSESQILPTTIVRLIPFRHNLLLLYPTGGYQQSIGTSADYVSVGDRWFIVSPYLQSLDMLRNWSASRLQSLIGTPTDRSLCHISVALSDRWISTTLSLGLFTNANEHNQLTSPHLMSTKLDMLRNWSAGRLQSLIGTPTDRSLCHPCTINGFDRIVTFRTPTYPSLGLPMNANEHS